MPSSRRPSKKADREPTSRAERARKGLLKGQRLRSNRQALLARRRQRARRERKREEALAAGRLDARVWVGPDPPAASGPPAGMDYGSRVPDDPEVAIRKQEPLQKPAPVAPRRAVRAEPKRGTHGPNRGGESARSWQPAGERNPTKVPVDVHDFMKEEF